MHKSQPFVVRRISDGNKPGQHPAHLGRALTLSGVRAGLVARVLADRSSSGAVIQRGKLGEDTEITPAPWRSARPGARRMLPVGRAQIERRFPGLTRARPGMRQFRPAGGSRHRRVTFALGQRVTCTVPGIRSRAWLMLLALPFAVIAAVGVSRAVIGPGWGLLPLLAVGPAVAATLGGPLYTLAAGAAALAVCLLFAGMQPGASHRMTGVTVLAVAGVTAASVLASRARRHRDRELAHVRLVAETAQNVVLRPMPRQAGPIRLAARYLSACDGARVGGDLYEVVTTPDCVRLIVGDAQGKGLPALQSAAAVLATFREAAHVEDSLEAIVSRIETSLARQLGHEQFVTAVLAEVSADGAKIELLGCGHPAPLLLSSAHRRFIRLDEGSLPLGLGQLAYAPRIPVTISFEPGDAVLFYTDGASEARDKAGAFFPIADSAAVRAAPDPATLADRLIDEVIRYVGHAPDDDMALLVIYRDGA
jgi:serine phosphatase RsbU (regulator of sigma subunit)